jgi:hypothetical protein
MNRLQRPTFGRRAAFCAVLLIGSASGDVRAQASSPLDPPPTVYQWKVPPSHAVPMIEMPVRHADEILLNVLVPDAPLMVTEMACGQPDMAYSPPTRTIILCREFASFVATLSRGLRRDLARAGQSYAASPDTGFITFSVLHETGHAVIHQLSLSNFGSGEDAADGFAAWALLHRGFADPRPGAAGDSIRNARLLMDAMQLFSQLQVASKGLASGSRTAEDSGDPHPMAGQRAERLQCYLIGRYPAQRRLTDSDERLGRCIASWNVLDANWRRALTRVAAGGS